MPPTKDRLPNHSPNRKRRRTARSCQNCRERKIRCDQNLPCASCVRSRASLQCSYETTAQVREGESDEDVTAGLPVTDDSGPVASSPLPRQLLSFAHHPQKDSQTPSSMSHQTTIVEAHGETIRSLEQRIRDLEGQLAQTTRSWESRDLLSRRDDPERDSSLVMPGASSIPQFVPRLRNAPSKKRCFGPTHWMYTASPFSLVVKFDTTEAEPTFTESEAEVIHLVRDVRTMRYRVKAQRLPKLDEPVPDLLKSIPPRHVCDELLRHYLRTMEPMYRIIHIPSFKKDYDRFWNDDKIAIVTTRFHMQLVLILAIGSTFHDSKDGPDRSHLRHLALTWIFAAQWWLTGPTENWTANIGGLQVACLLLLARKTVSSSPRGPSWFSAGSVLDMALSMGLHRDASIFPQLTSFERVMRTRLWTTVLELHLQQCVDTALPPTMLPDGFDAPIPYNVDDSEIHPSESLEEIPVRHGTMTDSSIQILLAKTLPLRLSILRRLNDIKPGHSYEASLSLGNKVQEACREASIFFQTHITNDSARPAETLAPTRFHRKLVDIHLRKYMLYLHRPFMIQACKDPWYYLARKVCVESATIIASYAKQMTLNSRGFPADDLEKLSRAGRGLFKGPLHLDAVLVLALETVSQLEESPPWPSTATSFDGDPLDRLQRAKRAETIATLEHIRDILLAVITQGTARLKPYVFLVGLIGQIKAMETGQSRKRLINDAVLDAMRRCQVLMRDMLLAEQSTDCGSGGHGGEGEGEGERSAREEEPWAPDVDDMTFGDGLEWDLAALFDLKEFGVELPLPLNA